MTASSRCPRGRGRAGRVRQPQRVDAARAVDGVDLAVPRRRDPRAGRRVRLRQDDAGPRRSSASSDPTAGEVWSTGARWAYSRRRAQGLPPPGAARPAGPVGLAQPAAHRLRGGGRGSAHPQGARQRGAPSPREALSRAGLRPPERLLPALPARAVGRSAPARRHRRRAGAAARRDRRRRAGLVAGRVGARRDPRAAARAARRARPDRPRRHARPRPGLEHRRPDRGDVPRPRSSRSDPPRTCWSDPQHPYTKALLSVVPEIDRSSSPLCCTGEPPDPTRIPGGCRFHPRCPALARGATPRVPASDAVAAPGASRAADRPISVPVCLVADNVRQDC